MNENFMPFLEEDDGNIYIDFNANTGDFTISGKTEINSRLYNMIKSSYQLQLLNSKFENGDWKFEDTNNFLSLLSNLYSDLQEVVPLNTNSRSEKTLNRNFWNKEYEFLKNHAWINSLKNRDSMFYIFKNVESLENYDKEAVVEMFLREDRGESFNNLHIKDKFCSYLIVYSSMFTEVSLEQLFVSTANFMKRDIDLYKIDNSLITYRIMLRSPERDVYVFYYK